MINLYETTYGFTLQQGDTVLEQSAFHFPHPRAALYQAKERAAVLRLNVGRNRIHIDVTSEARFSVDRQPLMWRYHNGDHPEAMNYVTPSWISAELARRNGQNVPSV